MKPLFIYIYIFVFDIRYSANSAVMVSSSNLFTKVRKPVRSELDLDCQIIVEWENEIILHFMNPIENNLSLCNAFSLLFYLNYVSLKSIQTTLYKFPSGCQSNSTNVMYSYSLHTKLVDKKTKDYRATMRLNLRNPLHADVKAIQRAIHSGFETRERHHQKSKTVAPQKSLMSFKKFIKQKTKHCECLKRNIFSRIILFRFKQWRIL